MSAPLTGQMMLTLPLPKYAIQVAKAPDYQDLLVGIRYDGGVDFGEGVTPDAAAQEFYAQLAYLIHRSMEKE